MTEWTLTPILNTEAETKEEAIANFQQQLSDMASDEADIENWINERRNFEI